MRRAIISQWRICQFLNCSLCVYVCTNRPFVTRTLQNFCTVAYANDFVLNVVRFLLPWDCAACTLFHRECILRWDCIGPIQYFTTQPTQRFGLYLPTSEMYHAMFLFGVVLCCLAIQSSAKQCPPTLKPGFHEISVNVPGSGSRSISVRLNSVHLCWFHLHLRRFVVRVANLWLFFW